VSNTLDLLRQRIEAKHRRVLADLEARHAEILRKLDSAAKYPESLGALEAVLGFLEEIPPQPVANAQNGQAPLPTQSSSEGGSGQATIAIPSLRLAAGTKRRKVVDALSGDWRTLAQLVTATGLTQKQIRGVLHDTQIRDFVDSRDAEGHKEYRLKSKQSFEVDKET
jgi:hypothetical protein